MKRNNKKGFTIVELVVVIAVIAILAAVLIPTFSGVTEKAKGAALNADLNAAYSQYTSEKSLEEEDVATVVYIKIAGNSEADDKYYEITKGDIANRVEIEKADCCANLEADGYVGGSVFEKAASHTFANDSTKAACDYCGASNPNYVAP